MYKQAVSAVALAYCFPGKAKSSKYNEMPEKITDSCIKIFENNTTNHFLGGIALALATIGNEKVVDYFLELIKNPEGENRYYAPLVLGSLNNERMLEELYRLLKLPDTPDENKKTKDIAEISGIKRIEES